MSALAMPSPAAPLRQFQPRLSELLARYLAAFDLLGRLHIMQWVKERSGQSVPLSTLTGTAAFTDVLGFESVPAVGAIARLRNLTSMTRAAFDGLAARYQMQAFTVAGVTDVRLIEQIQQALIDVLSQGGTQQDFENAVNALTDAQGIERLAAFHLETVFQTNIMTAYANGRFEQLRDPAVAAAAPYWQYRTAGDARVRPNHAAMEGFTARFDDPVWSKWYPPAGYNCRCTVIALLRSEAPEGADKPGLSRLPAEPDPGFGGHE